MSKLKASDQKQFNRAEFTNADSSSAHVQGRESSVRFVPAEIAQTLQKPKQRISRRQSLKWLGLMAAGSLAASTMPSVAASVSLNMDSTGASGNKIGHWPQLKLTPVSAKGYGQDPNLIVAPKEPWPLIMSAEEYQMASKLCDIICPVEVLNGKRLKSARELGAVDVLNEWVSAPYSWQQSDRSTIMHLFVWLDDEAILQHKQRFMACSDEEQAALIDDIAYTDERLRAEFVKAANAFSRLRELILAAYFTTAQGMKDIGYLGNVPINGDYPGPTDEAYAHLDSVLDELGLRDFRY